MPVKNIIPGQRVIKGKVERSRELRREMTPAEKCLWQEVHAKKLGVRFRNDEVLKDLSGVVGRIKKRLN